MKAKLPECQKRAWSGSEANIHKASFTERRLFYLNYYCHCEEGVLPDVAISNMMWEIASGKNKYALAMTKFKGM